MMRAALMALSFSRDELEAMLLMCMMVLKYDG